MYIYTYKTCARRISLDEPYCMVSRVYSIFCVSMCTFVLVWREYLYFCTSFTSTSVQILMQNTDMPQASATCKLLVYDPYTTSV